MTLTLKQFLQFLEKYCLEKHSDSPFQLDLDKVKSDAYDDIRQMIKVYLQDYAEERKLTKQAEQGFMDAIGSDKRRKFDNPLDLIGHIKTIAQKPPFFDSERISLAAILGFCNDYLGEHECREPQLNP